MKFTVGKKIMTGYLIALITVIIGGYIIYSFTTRIIDISGKIQNYYELLNAVDMMNSHYMDAESSLDSYFLLKEENNIKFYYESVNLTMEYLNKLEKTADKIGENKYISLAKEIKLLINDCFKNLNEKLDYIRNNSQEKSLEFMKQAEKKNISAELGKKDDIFEETARESLTLLLQKSDELYSSSGYMIMILVVIVVVVVSIIGYVITTAISRPLRSITEAANQMSTGDLNISVPEKYSLKNDETGVLVNSYMKLTKNLKKMAEIAEQISSGNLLVDITPQSGRDLLGNAFLRMKDNLLSMLKETTEAVNVLASASSQISSTTTQLAASATETAASISETTTTVEEVKQTSKHTTEKANQVSETVKNTDIISQEGEKSIAETINGMTKINEQMQIIAETIIKLSEQSRTIGEIVASVSDIAEQSNLLAVNASIEAAKAGEQGKGFSVVAMEIKNLAEQSKQATKQVKNILDEIQNSINNAVLSTEQGSKVVEVGIKKSEVAGESIKELATNIGESSNAALMILATSQQQSVGMDQVATAMENIKQASMQNVESIKQLEIAAVNIKDLGGKLKTQMEKYKI
jgi:methyl-accepting chemotaxis protein